MAGPLKIEWRVKFGEFMMKFFYFSKFWRISGCVFPFTSFVEYLIMIEFAGNSIKLYSVMFLDNLLFPNTCPPVTSNGPAFYQNSAA